MKAKKVSGMRGPRIILSISVIILILTSCSGSQTYRDYPASPVPQRAVGGMGFAVREVGKGINSQENTCQYWVAIELGNMKKRKMTGHASGRPLIYLSDVTDGKKWIYPVEGKTVGFGTVGMPATTILPGQQVIFYIKSKPQQQCNALTISVRETISFFNGLHLQLDFNDVSVTD